MLVSNPNIELVVAVLKGLDVDGESMQYIIEQVGMEDQMKKQLGGTSRMPQSVIEQLAKDIAESIASEGTSAITDYELSMSYNEVQVDEVTFDERVLQRAVEDALSEHFDTDEEE
jgi:phosphoenolpyruvate synthase/pyruvate phosphate dikinase